MIAIGEAKHILGTAGLKATQPRLAVFMELLRSENHPTADQVYENIRQNHPGIARGSVYRILDHLVEAGLAHQVASKQGNKRFDANLGQHNHIYCQKTHDIQDYFNEELNQLVLDFFTKKKIENFTIQEIKVQINGIKTNPLEKVKIV
ncbi:MAG: transcriptional repressor [Cyclobacteriaceae bacterium]|nr:transcriptional repressor [Cyclobacteriaceae bacterium]